jgi:hypothetical protein
MSVEQLVGMKVEMVLAKVFVAKESRIPGERPATTSCPWISLSQTMQAPSSPKGRLVLVVRYDGISEMTSGDSLVVTDPTTDPPLTSLTMGERTGSRIFW